jgi:YjjG family noncanonical pyrimidine nucleotidase
MHREAATLSKHYDVVLMDADETIYDFKRAERIALSKTLNRFGVEPDSRIIAIYSEGNQWCWKALERGDITRDELKPRRFRMLFERIGKRTDDYLAVNDEYERQLSFCGYMLPGAMDFLKKLHADYDVKIYLATNGLIIPQEGRFRRSGIAPYVDGMYISERVGVSKPDAAYFDYIFRDLGITDRSRTIMLGDSLTSDMQGGRNAGITTCCYLRGKQPTHSELCDYEIGSYDEFFEII